MLLFQLAEIKNIYILFQLTFISSNKMFFYGFS